jgi:mRNA interferase HicA
MKRGDLIRHLLRHGCVFVREGANHSWWENPASGKVAPVGRHAELSNHLARTVCRELGIPDIR